MPSCSTEHHFLPLRAIVFNSLALLGRPDIIYPPKYSVARALLSRPIPTHLSRHRPRQNEAINTPISFFLPLSFASFLSFVRFGNVCVAFPVHPALVNHPVTLPHNLDSCGTTSVLWIGIDINVDIRGLAHRNKQDELV